MEHPKYPGTRENDPAAHSEKLEKDINEVPWKLVYERAIEKVADQAVDPERRAQVMELNAEFQDLMTSGNNVDDIDAYLEAAHSRGIISRTLLDDPRRSFVFVPEVAKGQEYLPHIEEREAAFTTPSPSNWEAARTLVLREPQMIKGEAYAQTAVTAFQQFTDKRVPDRIQWIVLGSKPLKDATAFHEKYGLAANAVEELGTPATLISDCSRARLHIARQAGFAPIDDRLFHIMHILGRAFELRQWSPERQKILHTALGFIPDFNQGTLDSWVDMIVDLYTSFTAAQAIQLSIEEWGGFLEDPTQLYGHQLSVEKISPRLKGKSFDEAMNPYKLLLLGWSLGVPAVRFPQTAGVTLVVPSADTGM